MSNPAPTTDPVASIADARRREIAVEHLLFGTIRFVAHRHPGLLDDLDESLEHLWDRADDGTRDDEAVRAVARLFIKSLRARTENDSGADGSETP